MNGFVFHLAGDKEILFEHAEEEELYAVHKMCMYVFEGNM